jgi:Ca2+-transporting ATPase
MAAANDERNASAQAAAALRAPHAASVGDVATAVGATLAGFSEEEAARRRMRFGRNELRVVRGRSAWRIAIDQFRGVLVALLAAAAALSLLFGERHDAAAVIAVLVLNGAIGFATELQADRSMAALRRLGSVAATVRRAGCVCRVDAAELVPGDVVLIEGGDVVTADMRVAACAGLQVDESLLTGESVPVDKDAAPVSADAELAARCCMLFKGTAATRGSATAVVVGTAMNTELGRIAGLVDRAADEVTPLEQRLDRLAQRLLVATLLVAVGIAGSGLLAGRALLSVVHTSIALAVATVPEGLPIITTLALARGMRRMARRNAVVKRLAAVELLGATDVVFTDKTGTLTENRMTVAELVLPDGAVRFDAAHRAFDRDGVPADAAASSALGRALEVAALCNGASLDDRDGVGDPLEIALLVAARAAGIEAAALAARSPRVREIAFDPAVRMMATVHRADGGGLRAAVKGAPEVILAATTRVAGPRGARPLDAAERRVLLAQNDDLAARGRRVLALAEGTPAAPDADAFADLAFVGLVGLEDPPRPDVRDAVLACRGAGIRVVMVTGDQRATALSVARSVGLADADARVVLGSELAAGTVSDEDLLAASIFARTTPEQKLALVARIQERGHVVAMTGDGVNDAPALEKADIGIAMGARGTEVAREAADVVLGDDAFSTIVGAIAQGRVIFHNIRCFVVYLLSCNASEIAVVGLASAVAMPLPILPLQILFLNLVTDVFPALALGAGEGSPTAMRHAPRDRREQILERRHWGAIARSGALITTAVLGSLVVALHVLHATERAAVTISFLTLAFAQLWYIFAMRSQGSGLLRNEITRNPWVWAALALCTGLLVAAVHVAPLARILVLDPPTAAGWAVIALASAAPCALALALAASALRPGDARRR